MKYIKTNWHIPYFNFALEEYLLTEAPHDDYLFFYIHDPSIIVGRYQNTLEEINSNFVNKNNIHIARRLTGGGAVYHDEGNLNFSFVLRAGEDDVNNFAKFITPIIAALKTMDIEAELAGRNDILIDGRKISGNAQCAKNNMLIHHGTLLFNARMENLSKALNVKDLKIASKGTASVRSRVANIKDYMTKDMSISTFRENILAYMMNHGDVTEHKLDDQAIAWVEDRAKNKFATWDWNWGKSPAFDIQRLEKFPCGIVDARINVQAGKITTCKIYGDFFVKKDLDILEKKLIGLTYRPEALMELSHSVNISDFFHDMTIEEFVEFLCP